MKTKASFILTVGLIVGFSGFTQTVRATTEISWIRVKATDTMTADGNWTLDITDATPAMNVIGSATVTGVAGTTSGTVLDGLNGALATAFSLGTSGCTTIRSTVVGGDESIHVTCPFNMKCILSSTLPVPGTGPTDLQVAPVTFNGFIWFKNVAIPTVSTWGMAAMLLLVMVTGTIVFRRVSAKRVA